MLIFSSEMKNENLFPLVKLVKLRPKRFCSWNGSDRRRCKDEPTYRIRRCKSASCRWLISNNSSWESRFEAYAFFCRLFSASLSNFWCRLMDLRHLMTSTCESHADWNCVMSSDSVLGGKSAGPSWFDRRFSEDFGSNWRSWALNLPYLTSTSIESSLGLTLSSLLSSFSSSSVPPLSFFRSDQSADRMSRNLRRGSVKAAAWVPSTRRKNRDSYRALVTNVVSPAYPSSNWKRKCWEEEKKLSAVNVSPSSCAADVHVITVTMTSFVKGPLVEMLSKSFDRL